MFLTSRDVLAAPGAQRLGILVVALIAVVLVGLLAAVEAEPARGANDPPISVTVGGVRKTVNRPALATVLCLEFGNDGRIRGGGWYTFDNKIVSGLELSDGTFVTKDNQADSMEIGQAKPTSGPPRAGDQPSIATVLCLEFDNDGRIVGGGWYTFDNKIVSGLELSDGTHVLKVRPADSMSIGLGVNRPRVEVRLTGGTLPKQAVIPGVAGDSATGLPPPPQTLPKAPVLKTLGCASTAKVNQLIACQSDGAPGDANSPVTLLEWHAPSGIPEVGFDGIVFLTKYPEPGIKQITLKACSGDACTTLSQNVTVTADAPPPETVPAAPSGVQCINGFAGPLVVWTDDSNNETGFRVLQQTETAPVLVGTEAANITSHNLPEGDCNGGRYGVASYNSAGQSAIVWQTS